jgi:hypothetical protein
MTIAPHPTGLGHHGGQAAAEEQAQRRRTVERGHSTTEHGDVHAVDGQAVLRTASANVTRPSRQSTKK